MGFFDRSKSNDGTHFIALPHSTARPITASAQRVRLENKKEVEAIKQRRASEKWQDECWEYYDAIGEIKYSAYLVGAALSRMRIFAAAVIEEDQAPAMISDVPDLPIGMADDAIRALDRLKTANGGMSGLMYRAGLNLWVAGECYLVQVPARPSQNLGEIWDIKSVDELVVAGDGKLALRGTRNARTGQGVVELPTTAFAGRIWRSHARFSEEPDSSIRGIRELADELLLLGRTARATARSRLNAGAIYLPDGLSVSATPEEESEFDEDGSTLGTDAEVDDFEEELIDNMTAPILDESSAAAVVPLIIRGPAELADKIKQFKFERSFDSALVQRAETVLTRILHGIDVPKDVVTGMGHVRYCASSDTEIYTQRGWLRYDEITPSDNALTLNHATGLTEWQAIDAVNVFPVIDEPMRRVRTKTHSSLTTMDHKWPVVRNGERNWKISSELSRGDHAVIAAPFASTPNDSKYSDDFVELVAWYWTEGSASRVTEKARSSCYDLATWRAAIQQRCAELGINDRELNARLCTLESKQTAWYVYRGVGVKTRDARATLAVALELSPDVLETHWSTEPNRRFGAIVQSHTANADNVARIRRAMHSVFGPMQSNDSLRGTTRPAWREARHGSATYFYFNHEACEIFSSVCFGFDKVVTNEFVYTLTRAQLDLFIETSLRADGNGLCGITQSVEARLDPLELACILAGRATNRYVSQRVLDDGRVKTSYALRIKKRAVADLAPRVSQATIENYSGVVWCPTTENATWFARREGITYFTGNSNATQIDESLYRAHVEPLVLLICDALTEIYLRPSLIASGYTEREARRAVIWYDPSEILTRPDRAQSANDGLDKHAISYDAWRRAHGYSDADAPSDDELVIRAAIERAAFTPDVASALFKVIAPQLFKEIRAQNIADSPAPLPQNVQNLLNPGETAPAAPEEPAAPAAPTSETPPNNGLPSSPSPQPEP